MVPCGGMGLNQSDHISPKHGSDEPSNIGEVDLPFDEKMVEELFNVLADWNESFEQVL